MKNFYTILLILFSFCLTSSLFAQNDNCASAPTISASNLNGTCNNFNYGSPSPDPISIYPCGHGAAHSYIWWRFTAQGTYLHLELDPGYEVAIVHFNGGNCVDDPGNTFITNCNNRITSNSLVIGQQYYIMVHNPGGGGAACLRVYNPQTPPANDLCNNATNIVPHEENNVCINNYNFGSPLQDMVNFSDCNGGTEVNYNTWFKFTAHGPYLNIDGNPGVEYTIFDFAGAGDCNYLAGVTIVDLECGFGNSYETFNLVPGNEYFIMVSSIISNFPVSNFDFCILNPEPPVNNDCINAIEITDLDCETNGTSYDFEWSSNDVGTVGDCAHTGTTPNIWFSFTAQGSYAKIKGRPGFQFFILDFTEGLCDAAGAFLINNIECVEGVDVEFHDLELGKTYYVMVASTAATPPETVNLCIFNPPFPENDAPCNAISLTNGQCVNGTTYSAYPEYTPAIAGLNCASNGNSDDVWYSFMTGPRQYGASIELNNLDGFNEQVMVAIYNVIEGADCNTLELNPHTPFPADCYPYAEMEFLHLYPNTLYYIRIFSSSSNDMGNFQICLDIVNIPEPCSYSDECASAIEVVLDNPFDPFGDCAGGIPNPTGFSGCIQTCNIGSTPENPNVVSNCIQRPWRTTWYRFNPQNFDFLNVTLLKSGDAPTIGVVGLDIMDGCSGQSILAASGLNCGFADEFTNFIDLNGIEIPNQYANTDLYIVVGSSSTNTGHFELCVEVYDIVQGTDDYCAQQPSLLVPDALPPYSPGQTVNFTLTVYPYTQSTTIQWIQAIIPIFGAGWDPSSFQYLGGPPVTHSPPTGNATWEWFDAGQITYNYSSTFYTSFIDEFGQLSMCHVSNCPPDLQGGECFTDGTKLPAGWYAYSPGGGPNCTNNGDPNGGWGDSSSSPFTVTFSLTAREYDGPEGCSTTGYVDLGIEVYTLSDQQTGCWNNSNGADACRLDSPGILEALNKCCKGPEIDHMAEICSEGTFSYNIVTDQDFTDPDIIFTWNAQIPNGVELIAGSATGNTRNITSVFLNTTNSPKVVIYSILALNSAGCDVTSEIEVTVLPGLEVELPDLEVLCPGESITLSPNVSGGNGIYNTYTWTPGGQAGPSYTFTPSGTTSVIVQVTDSKGCVGQDNVTVTVAQPFTANVASAKQAYCENEEDREIFAPTPSTGEGAFTYNWGTIDGDYNAITQQRIKPLVSGTYSVTITDRHGCESTDEMEVVVYPAPTIVVNTQTSFCEDAEWEEFSVQGFSSQGPVPVFYNHGGMFPNNGISPEYILETFGPGPHNILLTATDELGCYAEQEFEFSITPNPDVYLPIEPICFGVPVHVLLPDPPNGIFSPGTIPAENILPDGTLILVDLDPGIYDFYYEVFDNGCSSIDTFEIEIIPPVQLDITPGKNFTWNCNSQPFQIGATNSGMNFTWTGVEGGNIGNSSFVSVNQPDTILVQGVDMEGCISRDTVIVVDDTTPPILEVDDTEYRLKCGDDLFGELLVRVDGLESVNPSEYSFTWSKISGDGSISGNSNVGQFNGEGIYRLHASSTLNHCDDFIEIEVFVDTLSPIITSSDDVIIDCQTTEYVISTTYNDDYTYLWSTIGGSIEPGQELLNEITVDELGTYVVEVTSSINNCVSYDTVNVSDIRAEILTDTDYDAIINCYNEGATSVSFTVLSGATNYNIEWYFNNQLINSEDDLLLNTTEDGEYIYIITNLDNNCTYSDTVQVDKNTESPIANGGGDQTVLCSDDGQKQLTGSTNITNATYQWTAITGSIVGGNPNELSVIVSGGTGLYEFEVTDVENGCVSRDTVEVTPSLDIPDLDLGEDIVIDCNTTLPITISAIPLITNFDYSWTTTGSIPTGQETEPMITVSDEGTYTLEVINPENDCKNTASINISDIRENINADLTFNAIFNCFNVDTAGIVIDVNNVDNPNYSWTLDGVPVGTDHHRVDIEVAGTYEVVVTNPLNHCEETFTAVIVGDFDKPNVDAGADTEITCSDDGKISLTGASSTPNVSYLWSTTNGCISGDNDQPTIISCAGGQYTLLITDNTNGCTSTDDVIVTVSDDIPIVTASDDIDFKCSTTTLILNADSNVDPTDATYTWTPFNNGVIDGSADGNSITVSAPGRYVVEVYNSANGCKASQEVFVNDIRQDPHVDAGPDALMLCSDDGVKSITGFSNTTNVSYMWSSPTGGVILTNPPTSATIQVGSVGTYLLTVTDLTNDCTSTDEIIITPDENIPDLTTPQDLIINCFNEATGVEITSSSSVGGLTYQWTASNNGQISGPTNTATVTASSPGTYTILITNPLNGCENTSEVQVIGDFDQPEIQLGDDQVITCIDQQATLTGDSPNNVTYSWAPVSNGNIIGSTTGKNILVDRIGDYRLTITDLDNGCVTEGLINVSSNDEYPHVDAGEDVVLGCEEFGIIQVTGNSSTTGVEYLWTSNSSFTGDPAEATIIVDKPGIYTLRITNPSNGCESFDSFEATFTTDLPIADAGADREITCEEREVILDGTGSSGNNLSYSWIELGGDYIPNPNTPSITVSTVGNFVLTVTNNLNGCRDTDNVVVTADPNTLSRLILETKDVRCYGENNGSLSILGFEGGLAPYTVSFEGINFTGNQINSLAPGEYTINVEDANGCPLEQKIRIYEPDSLGVYIGETDTIKKGQSVHIVPVLYGTTPVTSFTWDTSTYLFCEGCPAITFSPDQSMRVTVNVVDENGCTATHFKWIIVERDPHIYVPNILAPGRTTSGQGNDKLIVYGGAEVKGFKSILIFDRWGNQIFELNDFQSGNSVSAWDGTFKGKPVQTGVYVYTLTAIMQDDTEVQVNGDVTVLY